MVSCKLETRENNNYICVSNHYNYININDNDKYNDTTVISFLQGVFVTGLIFISAGEINKIKKSFKKMFRYDNDFLCG